MPARVGELLLVPSEVLLVLGVFDVEPENVKGNTVLIRLLIDLTWVMMK